MCKRLSCSRAVIALLLAVFSGHLPARLIPVTHCWRGIVNNDFENSTLECWTDYEDDGNTGSGAFPGGRGDGNGGHGSPVSNDNHGDRTDVPDASTGDDLCEDGANPSHADPIVLGTGDKIEREVDFVSTGEMPLTLTRTQNHFWKYVGLFGKHWVSSFDYSLVWQSGDALIFAQRPDGRRIKFIRVGTTNRWNEDKPTPVAYILLANGTYTHYTENDGVETYDGGGKPQAIKNAHGVGWTYTYTSNYPTKITHTSGRYVTLGWTSGQLTTVTDPSGAAYTYTYTANAFGAGVHRLASATHPGATGDPAVTTTYYYEDLRYAGGLTGKAYNGVRYSTFAYDDQARAIKSEHATGGIDRFTYAYTGIPVVPPPPPPDPPPPGSNCNPVTHQCPAPPAIDDAQMPLSALHAPPPKTTSSRTSTRRRASSRRTRSGSRRRTLSSTVN